MKTKLIAAGLLALALMVGFQSAMAGTVASTAFTKDENITGHVHLVRFTMASTAAGVIDTTGYIDLRGACAIYNANTTLTGARMTYPLSIQWNSATSNCDTIKVAVDTSMDGTHWVQFQSLTALLASASGLVNVDTLAPFARLRCQNDLSSGGTVIVNLTYPVNCAW